MQTSGVFNEPLAKGEYIMTEDEKVQYLANIYHVARADGRVEVLEDGRVEDMAAGIGAGYLETRNALDLSARKDFSVIFPARLSERIRNMEDMLFLAYADQDLHDMEKKIIVDYARQIGVTQDQVNMIKKEAKARLKQK